MIKCVTLCLHGHKIDTSKAGSYSTKIILLLQTLCVKRIYFALQTFERWFKLVVEGGGRLEVLPALPLDAAPLLAPSPCGSYVTI